MGVVLLTSITTGHTYSQIGQFLTTIPSNIPPETISVDLTANNIHQIADSDFIGTIFIEELYLVNNDLNNISDNALTPLAKLLKLYMSRNKFTSMPPLEPISATIQELKLDKNQITFLKADYFINFINLTLLHLHMNDIHTLPENAFVGLNNLVQLRLNHNELICVNKALLDGMNALEYIDLSNNLLTTFLSEHCPLVANETTQTPAQLPNLSNLILKWNILNVLPDLRGAPLLHSVDFNHNQLSDINLHYLEGLSKLRVIVFSSNKNIKNFPKMSTILDPKDNSLTKISISDTGLSLIDEEILINLVYLNTLLIDNNNLQSLSFLSTQKAVLGFISISRNKLESLNSMKLTNSSWEKLRKIIASNNKITHIDNVLLDQFPALQKLDLSYNRISVFPELARIGSPLVTAYFQGNNISWVNVSSFVGLSNIKSLIMNNNILTRFPLSVFTLVSTIRDIDLSNNLLTYVDELSPNEIASTDLEVTLTDNPFNCDQSILWIKKLNSTKMTMTLSPKPCASPVALISVPWDSITADDLGISKFRENSLIYFM